MEDATRACRTCKEEKPFPSGFYKKLGKRAATCKDCHKAQRRRDYDEHLRVPKAPAGHPCAQCGGPVPEKKIGGTARKFCSRLCAVAYNRASMPARSRGYVLARYGLTPEEYERLKAEQQGRCAICGTTEPATQSGVWHVDHCHGSNVVRGLLCTRCNLGLGYFQDDPERLMLAARYLQASTSGKPQLFVT